MSETITSEQIAQHYSAAMDSVKLLIEGKPESMTEADWEDCVNRNIGHLRIMVDKDFWTTEDLKPMQDAIHTWLDQ